MHWQKHSGSAGGSLGLARSVFMLFINKREVKPDSEDDRNSGSIPTELIEEWYYEYPSVVLLEFTSENKAYLIGSGWHDVSVSGNKVVVKGLGTFKYLSAVTK
jgi:hypothetical protein